MNNYYSNKDVIFFKKVPHAIISYNTILIIMIILLLIVCNLKYKKYINYYAYYNDDYLTFETNLIYDFNDLYINNIKRNYSVVSIDNSDKEKYLVKIKSKIEDKWVKNNSYIKIKFLQKETSILNEVVKIIWKG